MMMLVVVRKTAATYCLVVTFACSDAIRKALRSTIE